MLQPEATGAAKEVTNWLKPHPSECVSRLGDSASVQAVTRVNAEQSSGDATTLPGKATAGMNEETSVLSRCAGGSGDSMHTRKAYGTREAPRRGRSHDQLEAPPAPGRAHGGGGEVVPRCNSRLISDLSRHRRGFHRRARRQPHRDQHGRQRSLAGQRVRRAPVAQRPVRGGLPETSASSVAAT
jgi:hypothetical protein